MSTIKCPYLILLSPATDKWYNYLRRQQMEALIRNTPSLEAACAAAQAGGILALDTEFVWMRTYRPQLGIVQLGCRAGCWALDAT